jgi:hypothetical protein
MELELTIMLAGALGAIALVVAALPRAKRLDGFAHLMDLSRLSAARSGRHGARPQPDRTRL